MRLIKPTTALHNGIEIASVVPLLGIVTKLRLFFPLTYCLLEPAPGILGPSTHSVLTLTRRTGGRAHGSLGPRFRLLPECFQLCVRVPCPFTELPLGAPRNIVGRSEHLIVVHISPSGERAAPFPRQVS